MSQLDGPCLTFAYLLLPTALFVVIAGFHPSPIRTGPDGEKEFDPGSPLPTVYYAGLRPLNNSRVRGEATLTSTDRGLHVSLTAEGLASGIHPQHVHAGPGCDRVGSPILDLEPYPKAGPNGLIMYERSGLSEPDRLADRTVVLHGPRETPIACGPISTKTD